MDLPGDTSQVSDDERSSSLSDLDEGPEAEVMIKQVHEKFAPVEGDSEAETERLEESPSKALNRPLGESERPSDEVDDAEVERFSDSAISSPAESEDEPLSEEDSDQTAGSDEDSDTRKLAQGQKRKRMSQEEESDANEDHEDLPRRKRLGSIKLEADVDHASMDDEDLSNSDISREGSVEAMDVMEDHEDNITDVVDEDQIQDKDQASVTPKGQKGNNSTALSRLAEHEDLEEEGAANDGPEDPIDGPERTDEEDLADGDDVEDAEAAARSEEEQAKRTAAMESLLALEKRFATLRDRLYDERIAALNNELSQLSGSKPTHPELVRQLQCIRQYRDDKFEVEQKLLVFKIGALKRKSVAERSQIHSAYFQTIRDIRERHLERASEFFHRIQRDRFKTDESIPNYSIPFPSRRSQQITQQTAYNKEVSILSGIAKYVGFPAAPDLGGARPTELTDDMEKMGISLAATKAAKTKQSSAARPAFSNTLTRPAAEEEFLEQTPWANPQHPVHQQMHKLTRPETVQTKAQELNATPANQKPHLDIGTTIGSASTIPEHPSAPASSTFNTPHAPDGGQPAIQTNNLGSEAQENLTNANSAQLFQGNSTSPSETRKTQSNTLFNTKSNANEKGNNFHDSSPTTSRLSLFSSPARIGASRNDFESRRETASPITFNQRAREGNMTSRTELNGIGAR